MRRVVWIHPPRSEILYMYIVISAMTLFTPVTLFSRHLISCCPLLNFAFHDLLSIGLASPTPTSTPISPTNYRNLEQNCHLSRSCIWILV